ncbi:hypothetical protein JCM10512_914 [Bacteroides reticulotermitis JCM 10512]|uniref:Uncharacterized protein n=1 Tax=Bacteroides reticulotermitis JCM 10512 TaxID=1445607 RepID=W4UP15_9BACE|nr:hypothetical protein JCM10512_914 [Bacteroides reticulotermitis JCM 10512]
MLKVYFAENEAIGSLRYGGGFIYGEMMIALFGNFKLSKSLMGEESFLVKKA